MAYPTSVSDLFATRFQWNERRNEAAALLAIGKTYEETAGAVNVTKKTIYNWMQDMEFAAEVDRLSLMVGIASRAQRLRWLNRTIANRINPDGSLQTDKDVVDLLKIAISETDGAKLDFSKLAELLTGESGDAVESSGPGLLSPSSSEVIETTATSNDDGLLNPS